MKLPAEYPYNPRWKHFLAIAFFFGLCGVAIASLALRPRNSLPDQLFFGGLAVMSFLFVIGSVVLIGRRLLAPKVLRLEADALVLPHGFLHSRITRIPYAEIESLEQLEVYGTKFLEMTCSGRKYSIASSLVPSFDSFEEIKACIESKRLPAGINWRG